MAVHDPGKIVCDLAISLALGGDSLADAALLRAGTGRVRAGGFRSDDLQMIATLAAVLKAIDGARAEARARGWRLAGEHAPHHAVDLNHPLVVDVDATLVTAHSDKERAKPTFKKGYGFHPLCVFVDHG